MKALKRKLFFRTTAIFLIINHLGMIFSPEALALTAGPASPEFSSFEPVATTDMVNLFSGDFTYNLPVLDVPGPEGSGYALSLAYHSGATAEQESSFVGFGWTLNPGSINRSVRGFPDEFNHENVTRYNKTTPNLSGSISARVGNPEIFGADIPISYNTSVRMNNYQGITRTHGIGLNIKGMVAINMNIDADGPTFSLSVNPMGILSAATSSSESDNNKQKNNDEKMSDEDKKRQMIKDHVKRVKDKQIGSIASVSSYGLFTQSEVVRAVNFTKYTGTTFNMTLLSLQINPAIAPVGLEGSYEGNVNYQINDERAVIPAYGFMHNPNLNTINSEEPLTDYYVENEAPFQKRDYKLGVPFNNADNFTVTGENLSGGFRYFPNSIGHNYPHFGESKIDAYTAGIEFMIGPNLGIGIDFGFGDHFFTSSDWSYSNRSTSSEPGHYQFNSSTGGFFRFNNDLGGKVEYTQGTGIDVASLHMESSLPATKVARPVIGDGVYKTINDGQPSGRSSYIEYHTFGDLATQRFNKNINRSEVDGHSGINNMIAEFRITGEDGTKSIYGLPVLNKNEVNLQFDAHNSSATPCESSTNNCNLDNYLIYQDVAMSSSVNPDITKGEIVTGETRTTAYAGTHLLTQIITPNYVDVTNDGTTPDDFGGYTNFHYYRRFGGSNWYHWRTPYTGLAYQRNQLSDSKDNLGSFRAGDKEVYYLKAIETRTHIAFFVTNKRQIGDFAGLIPSSGPTFESLRQYLNSSSGSSRKDGLGALKLGPGGGIEPASNNMQAKDGTQELEFLEAIHLFSKGRLDKPLKTIRFQYSNELVQNLPNNSFGRYPQNDASGESGKLTLKRVWFEYEGLARTRISPYEFTYSYKRSIEHPDELKDHGDPSVARAVEYGDHYDRSAENPPYQPQYLDDWGFPQPFAAERNSQMKPSYQAYSASLSSFDPAAWQLKQIRLPSGGEILIQYEQNDYNYVHDRRAMTLVSLLETPASDDRFVLNLRDLGIDPTNQSAVDSVKTFLDDYFGSNGENEKIYFKFLYNFKNQTPSLSGCQSEFITGYAEYESSTVLHTGSEHKLEVKLRGQNMGDQGRTTLPRTACYDYYVAQRQGFSSDGSECVLGPYTHFTSRIADRDLSMRDTWDILWAMSEDWADFTENDIPAYNSVCQTLLPELSYLKIPMSRAKKGGGIRVKRLLMLDNGIETGAAAIYGNEYRYRSIEGSSGVATNEPTTMREENALVTFMPRKEQSWFSRLTAGLDKKQMEGPIGSSILPSPSIGYSHVEVHGIHSGPTGTGFSAHDFFTAKDYPYDKYYATEDIAPGKGAAFSDLEDHTEEDILPIPMGLFNMNVNKAWMSQGYRFIISNMHGLPKANQMFGIGTNAIPYLVSSEEFKYYEPGEKVKIMGENGTYFMDTPGKEMDLCMEMKSLSNEAFDYSFEADVSIGLSWVPPIFITVAPTISMDDSGVSTHVTSKVIRYPSILKEWSTYIDGSYNIEQYLAFSPFTGKPVLTRTFDNYHNVKIGNDKWDGSLYKLDVPAAIIPTYSAMGPMSGATPGSNQLKSVTGTFITYGKNGFPLRPAGAAGPWILQDVVKAEVQTYSSVEQSPHWIGNQVINDYFSSSAPISALEKYWYPRANYTTKLEVTSANKPGEDKVYKAGILKGFRMFDWANEPGNLSNGWIKTNEVTLYSPYGVPLEEVDALGIYHAARYDKGYSYTVPSIRADNARYGSLFFNDFENATTNVISGGHSGLKALRITPASASNGVIIADRLYASTQIKTGKGSQFMIWAQTNGRPDTDALGFKVTGTITKYDLEYIADVNGWTLLYGNLPASGLSSLDVDAQFSIDIVADNVLTTDVLIDDVRFQPFESQGVCYVYDPQTLKLIAQFDDQHFGMFYQYNQEGKLVRKLIETERGVKTIQETQYNTPTSH